MARAALTAGVLVSMSSPALAHPSMKHYVEGHAHEVEIPAFWQGLEVKIEHGLEAEARREWRRLDRKWEARQRRLERQREARHQASLEAGSWGEYGGWSPNWGAIAECESGGDWALVTTGNGYYFGLQFDPDTWVAYGGDPAYLDGPAPPVSEQIAVAERVAAGQGGANAWPVCWWEQ